MCSNVWSGYIPDFLDIGGSVRSHRNNGITAKDWDQYVWDIGLTTRRA